MIAFNKPEYSAYDDLGVTPNQVSAVWIGVGIFTSISWFFMYKTVEIIIRYLLR